MLLTCLATAIIMSGCKKEEARKVVTDFSQNQTAPVKGDRLTLVFAGELMQQEEQIKSAMRDSDRYDYSGIFDLVKPEISSADLAIANLEFTLGGKPYKGFPRFSAPDEWLEAILDCGFDILSTSNNHCMDTGQDGALRTLDLLDDTHTMHLGTYRNREEYEQHYPLIVEKNGFRIGLLSFTLGTNNLDVPSPFVVNLIDTTTIARDLEKAKAKKTDVIIALPHMGVEYEQLPCKEQMQLAEWLFDHGVDHFIGGHPHVVEPMEVRTIKGKRHLLAYSLGNFISCQTPLNTNGGAIVKMTLEKNENGTQMVDCSYSLTWISTPMLSGKNVFRIYPANHTTKHLNYLEKNKRDAILRSMRKLLNNHNKGGIKEKGFKIED